MTANEIRNSFLKFFEERGHRIVPSASVIPYDDPTLLFANAGMNQFKDVFLGTGKREYTRATDSQKCIRVSGKHNDLEEVGRDTYHHTFFEMLGNWSFGDYYKKEAIEWAWELLTKVWGLDKKRLYATVFENDDEAEGLWRRVTDIDPSHVLRFGKKDNFWEMGETGPCGPCSEIHIDLSEKGDCGHLVNAGDPRVMEIWNLVFIQYDRDAKGNLTPLPAKHVDTGMGFERICAVLQGRKSNYNTDVFSIIIQRIAEITKKSYDGSPISDFGLAISNSQNRSEISDPQSAIDTAMRVIADHVRMLTFSIADGGIPSNEGRGYVMRRILRRAARFGRNLEMHEPFIHKVVEAVMKSMGDQYPEIKEKQSHIERVIKGEEESFGATLDRGLEIFESVIGRIGGSQVFSGEDAFKLYDTYGFPLDLTQMMCAERGLSVDVLRFEELMEGQRRRSQELKAKWVAGPGVFGWGSKLEEKIRVQDKQLQKFDFNYDELTRETEIEIDGITYQHPDQGHEFLMGVILRETTFYAQGGGQVGDTGILSFKRSESEKEDIDVFAVSKYQGRTVHILNRSAIDNHLHDLLQSFLSVKTLIDIPRRLSIMRNHTATHLVHEALRRVLGTHAHQQGSLVGPDHLRFDFNHFEKITPDQLKAIEEIVNEKISQSISVTALNDPKDWLTIEEAKEKYPNVKMFFGEKYGDRVRVVQVKDFCAELCGGTHVKNTKDIGLFKIVSESSIASGIRRIEAVTGEGLNHYIRKQLARVGELDDRLALLVREQEQLEKELGVEKEHKLAPVVRTIEITSDGKITIEDVEGVERMASQREELIEQVSKLTNDFKKELSKVRVKGASSTIDAIIANSVLAGGFKIASGRIEAGSVEELKSLGDTLRSKLSSGVGVLGAVVDEKVALVCVVTDDLVKKLQAGKIVGELAKLVGGGGGGRPHLATAGGKDVSKLDDTLKQTPSIVQSMLKP